MERTKSAITYARKGIEGSTEQELRKLYHMGLIAEEDYRNEVKSRVLKERQKNQDLIKAAKQISRRSPVLKTPSCTSPSPMPRILKSDSVYDDVSSPALKIR